MEAWTRRRLKGALVQDCTSRLEAESAVTALCPIDRFARPLTRLRPTAGYWSDAFSSPNSCASSDRGVDHIGSTGFRNRLLSSDHFQQDADLLLIRTLPTGDWTGAADQSHAASLARAGEVPSTLAASSFRAHCF